METASDDRLTPVSLDVLYRYPELLRERSRELHELQRVDDRTAKPQHRSREPEL